MVYTDLTVWRKAIELVKAVYGITKNFPADERFALSSQLKRAAVSIPSNIVEGNGRGTTKDYLHFLRQARGSLFEVQTQLIISEELGFAPNIESAISLTNEISRMLNTIIQKLKDE